MDINPTDLGLKGAVNTPDAAPLSKVVGKWLKEVADARKLEKDFRREGHRIVELFEGEKKRDYQFNILYSNTETMLPALYNSVPRPVVQRRFKDEDPLGKLASVAAQRTLEYLVDDGSVQYTPFDDLMKSATLEALVPGRGLTRFKYDASIETQQLEAQAEAVESPAEEDEAEDEVEGDASLEHPVQESVKYETVCGEEIPWDRFLHGNAKKWKDIPWGAIEHFMTREELEKNFGEVGAKIPVIEMAGTSATSDEGENDDPKDDTKNLKVAQVYEIWDKDEKKVLFISPQWKSEPIKEVDDPLGLSGFFPWPRPLAFVAKVSTLTPVSLYTFYEEQAKELNRVTVRINKIISALKVRGMYDSTVEGIEKVLQADDNTLVPAENVAALLAQGNALEKAVWLMPIEKLVSVLQQLYTQREQVKKTIYEITGIADIMRGASQASETLGAQELKNQWGTLRLKKAQKEVMRYCRDCLRIMAEIAVSKLAPETLKAMTGLPYPTGSEKAQAGQQLQMMQQQQQQVAQQAQMTGQQPPPPQQPPPQLLQAAQSPSWDDILGMLRDDIQRSYRIDIETNSTVDAEATEDKKDMAEVLTAISQFMTGIGPMVQSGVMPFEIAQGMLLTVVRRYRMGVEMEDSIKGMKPPQQANPDDLAKKQKELEAQQKQLEAQATDLEKQKVATEQAVQQKQAVSQQQLQQQVDQQKALLTQQAHDLELQKQSAAQEQMFAAKELDLQKAQMLKEIDFAKQMAMKEADFTQQMRIAETDQKISAKEHSLQLKQDAHARTIAAAKPSTK
jgi:hypothetical protein